jgi:Winged helix-turn helix
VRRVGARQMVDFTPGRPCVRPRLRRTSVVKGVPRSRWLTALGLHDPLVIWWQPQTWPSWLAREALAARPDSLVLREARCHLGRPGFRTRQVTLVTTLLDAQTSRACDLAGLYRQRWQVATSLAHLTDPCIKISSSGGVGAILPCMNSTPSNWREARRFQAWHLKQQGWSQRRIAAALGVSEGAVSQWMKRARDGGVEALRHRPPPGAPSRLTAEQRAHLPALL